MTHVSVSRKLNLMSDPFASGAGGSGASITDFEGDLLYIVPTEYLSGENAVKTADFGDKDVVVADVHVLDGDNKGAVEEGVYIFQGRLIGRLKRLVGRKPYVGRLGKGKEKVKGNFPWEFSSELTDKERKLAREYHDSLPKDEEDPFAS